MPNTAPKFIFFLFCFLGFFLFLFGFFRTPIFCSSESIYYPHSINAFILIFHSDLHFSFVSVFTLKKRPSSGEFWNCDSQRRTPLASPFVSSGIPFVYNCPSLRLKTSSLFSFILVFYVPPCALRSRSTCHMILFFSLFLFFFFPQFH